jgi:uncharacterized protein
MKKNNAAILFFSRTAKAEAKAKPLALGKQAAQSVASFMVNHVKKLATQTRLPVFFYSETQQRGDTFGERFANAFDDIFAKGFEHVIAVGNDCLMVSTDDILDAAKALETTPSVFGATTDGGAYCIGLDKTVFQKDAFQNIHWQSNFTLEKLIQFVEIQAFETFLLPIKSDIDSVSDWQKTLKAVAVLLRKKLLQLINIYFSKLLISTYLPINNRFLTGSIALRAPPFFF